VFDLLLIAIVLLSAMGGYVRGALQQVLGLAALLAAYLISAPFGPMAGRMVMARADWSAGVSYAVGRLIAGLIIYAILTVAIVVVTRALKPEKRGPLQSWNRWLGSFVGLMWGLVLLFTVLFLADVALKVLPEASGWAVSSARRSLLRRWAAPVNPADKFLVTDTLRMVRAAREDPKLVRRLSRHTEVRKLLEHPDFKAVLRDEKLVAALHRKDVNAVLKNENFGRLLANKELMSLALSREVRSAVQDVFAEEGGGLP
jgi:uncharacterized membrane protein required for colicin V production